MPSRRRPRRRARRSRRRVSNTRSYRYSPQLNVSHNGLLTSDAAMVTLRCADSKLVSTGATNRSQVFGNGMWSVSPDAGFTAQPAGFDQWMTLYNRYEVISSTLTTRVQNLSILAPLGVVMYPSFDNTDVQFNDGSAYPYSVTKYAGVLPSGAYQAILKKTMSTRKLYGRSTDSVNFTGSVNTNPADVWRWIMEFFSLDGASPLNYRIQYSIDYKVKFYERKAVRDI